MDKTRYQHGNKNSKAARVIFTAVYNEVYQEEYIKTYSDMIQENLPACIANDIADRAANKKSKCVAAATTNSYHDIKRRNEKW